MREPRNIIKPNWKLKNIDDCYAKSHIINGERKFTNIKTHSLIVGEVAGRLKKLFNEDIKNRFLPDGIELTAALHDIGKINPKFQDKIEFEKKVDTESPHSEITEATLREFNDRVAKILGKHHGLSSRSVLNANAEIYGGKDWQDLRVKFLSELKEHFSQEIPEISSDIQGNIIAGLITVADWIGSGIKYQDSLDYKSKIDELVSEAGFIPFQVKKGLTFNDIFDSIKEPNELQKKIIDKNLSQNGIYIIEAPMGMGKTEAALYLAYKNLETFKNNGIYFALPTQLTSEKIYERFNPFLSKILEGTKIEAKLLHSKNWMKIYEEGEPGKSWFDSKKKGLLAPFAVGTLDQALMSVLNVRHSFVRTFGLLGKVVIIDEVHSYDMYMGTLLKELVENLSKMGSCVIILSATLRKDDKNSIIGENLSHNSNEGYPLITSYNPNSQEQCRLEFNYNEEKNVSINFTNDIGEAIDKCIEKAKNGFQILWIENSVDEAQEVFRKVNNRISESEAECGLLHSRFIKRDREGIEDKWLKYFDKESRGKQPRDKGRILIGTQILEQSLDIDADFIITKICPTDMLLQRMGRLWRHKSNDPYRPINAKREVLIITPEIEQVLQKDEILGNTGKVYSKYVIYRTIEILKKLKEIRIPSQIRELIESTYSDRNETDQMIDRFKKEMLDKQRELRNMALRNSSQGLSTFSEEKAFTRYSYIENTDIILIRKIRMLDNGLEIEFLNSEKIVLEKNSSTEERTKIAIKLMENTVTVPAHLAPYKLNSNSYISEILKSYIYSNDENPLRLAKVNESGYIESVNGGDVSQKYDFIYNSTIGYSKKDKK